MFVISECDKVAKASVDAMGTKRRVTLRSGNNIVHEDITCGTREEAERIASARYPGYKVTGFNGVWENPKVKTNSSGYKKSSKDSSSDTGSSIIDSISSDGKIILGLILGGIWFAIEFWYIFWPVVSLGIILYVLGSMD